MKQYGTCCLAGNLYVCSNEGPYSSLTEFHTESVQEPFQKKLLTVIQVIKIFHLYLNDLKRKISKQNTFYLSATYDATKD